MGSGVKRALVIALAAVVLAVAAAAAYYYGRIAPLIEAGKKQGTFSAESSRPSVAAFGFAAEDGTHRTIRDLKGRVVVVDVWASWCVTCIASIPEVVSLHKKYVGQPIEIIGLNVDDEQWDKIKPFLKRFPEINYTIAVPSPAPSFLLQSIVDLSPLGKVSAIPTVFVIDKQGRLAGKFIELGHAQDIDDLVSRLLAE